MENNYEVERKLRVELNSLELKLYKLTDFKYGNHLEYLKLGSDMCSLLDIQENIMRSYREVLIARIILIERSIGKDENIK